MPTIIPIRDIHQPELDVFARLTENQLRNRLEPEKGVCIVQSPKVIGTALDCGLEPLSILSEPKHLVGQGKAILDRCGDIPVYTARREQLEQLTGYSLTRGLICAMRRPRQPSLEELCAGARRIAILDGVVDATNVGAIVRSAAALGMDAVLVSTTCCDPLNRRAIRVSMGTIFQIPWTEILTPPDGSLPPWLGELNRLGFKIAAMALRDNSVSIDDPALLAEDRLAVLLGAEGYGLPAATIDRCDYTVRIPMDHGVDSLNVAAASAVAFWQLRQK